MQGDTKDLINVDAPTGAIGLGSPRAEGCSVPLNSDSLHDLASPINQVRAMTELILKRYQGELDDDAGQMFRFLGNASERLENLLIGLKTYMRVVGTRAAYRSCDGHTLLDDALASSRLTIEQNAAVVTSEPLPELYCDPYQISFVFASLIENAIKFRGEQNPEIRISVTREDEYWVFSIHDNGIGIDPRHSERIFSVFKRINPGAYPGAGVGLAITRQIIEEHGGRIWVESKPGGGGATFYFTLPGGECA